MAMTVQKVRAPETPVIKGSRDGLRVIFPVKPSFEDALAALSENLAGAGNFFAGARAVVEPSRELTPDEQQTLRDTLARHGLELTRVRPAPVRSRGGVDASQQSGERAVVVRHTVRSGQRVSFDGSVVVMGDVNPGGEVLATGDIAVLGALRGVAHAGTAGDHRAVVIALSLRPVQLRIADLIVRTPEGENAGDRPEVARVKNGEVVVEPYRWHQPSRRRR